MPELDGWEMLERIRDMSEVPVLMLTARGDELERVRGLQSGADDYVVKPFGKQELVARVQALLRRASQAATDEPETYADAYLSIDCGPAARHRRRAARCSSRRSSSGCSRPSSETRARCSSRDQLLDLVWGDSFGVGGDQVKLYIGYLRRKLEPDAPDDGADRDRARLRLSLQGSRLKCCALQAGSGCAPQQRAAAEPPRSYLT